MTTLPAVRRFAAVLGTLASLVAGTAIAVAPADGAAPGAAPDPAPRAGGHRTALTFEVPGCEGCRFQLYQGREASDAKHPTAWISREKKVRDGVVSFVPRSRHTFGMTATVIAPWEGQTGYLTTVVFRYGHEQVGDEVSFREARSKRRATGCWEGTRRDALTIPVVVRKVMVQGVQERVEGSIAYLPTTQSWLPPMQRARHGVLGTQEIQICG